ncbi:Hypothetical protein A7982_01549 [Minicystis rosea]|nr:Hypothetical protein A7982_01549 [Minicystis rosea]
MVTVVSALGAGILAASFCLRVVSWYEMSVRVMPRWERYGWIALNTAMAMAMAVRLTG